MKKLILSLMTAFLLLTCIPMSLKAGIAADTVSMIVTKPTLSVEVNALIARLNEIKAIDKSKLSATERKQIRKEVRSIKKNINDNGSGIYISVGAIIIIILLLILIL